MAGMLAVAVIIGIGILNVSFMRFFPESCLFGHPNQSNVDVRSEDTC